MIFLHALTSIINLLQVAVDELKTLLAKYSSTDQLAQSGITIAGMKYMYLSSSDKVVRAKKGTSGVHCIKTTQGASVSERG